MADLVNAPALSPAEFQTIWMDGCEIRWSDCLHLKNKHIRFYPAKSASLPGTDRANDNSEE